MQSQDDRVILEQLALEIAKSQAEKNREVWAKQDGDDALGKTIAATLAKIGFDEKGIPGVRPHLLEMVTRREISVRSTFNDLPPGEKTDISANMEGWYMSREDADKVRDYLLPGKRETQGNNSADHSGATKKAVLDDGVGRPDALTPTTTFRPRLAWQVVLFDSWLSICKTHSRTPTPVEAVRWMKRNDTTGTILDKGTDTVMLWQPQRGQPKKVTLARVSNVISEWRVKGVIPT